MTRSSPQTSKAKKEAARRAARRDLQGEPPLRRGLPLSAKLVALGLGMFLLGWIVASLAPEGTHLGGPLQEPDLTGRSSSSGARGAEGEEISFGLLVPWNASAEPVVLERISPIAPTGGIEVVGTGVLPPGSNLDVSGGFPPNGVRLPPVRNYTVEPGSGPLDGMVVVVGVRATGGGLAAVPAWELRYRTAGSERSAIILQGVWICVPTGSEPRCPEKETLTDRQRQIGAVFAPYLDVSAR
jgi:hypothetical protein